MPTYKYVAVNLQKKKYKGLFIAEDEKDLAMQLTKQDLYLVSAKEYKGGTPSAFFTLGTGKVKLSELTTFCRQFSIMISTGITLSECVDSLKMQPYSAYFKSILQVVGEDVKGGAMLSSALDKHKKVFPDFFRSMVHVGEASGKLDEVFVALADYYENDASIKRKVRSSLSYGAIVRELNRIGNNINQIAAKQHSHGFVDEPMLREAVVSLQRMEREFTRAFAQES